MDTNGTSLAHLPQDSHADQQCPTNSECSEWPFYLRIPCRTWPIGLGEFAEFVRSRNGPLATYATHMTHILEISITCSTVNFEHFESSCQPTVQLTTTGTTGTTGITLTWAPGNQVFDGFLLHPKSCLAVFDIRRQGEHHWDPGGLFECGKSKYFYSRDKRLAEVRDASYASYYLLTRHFSLPDKSFKLASKICQLQLLRFSRLLCIV